MGENRLVLLGLGCNSQVFTYGAESARVVLKVVSCASKKEQRHLKNEFQLLKGLQHQHIIKALRYQEKVAFQGNKLDKQFTTKNILVLEFATEGSLLAYITSHPLSLPSLLPLFRQTLSALHYLHSQGIAHRDLKLENVLLTLQNQQLTIKLSDFGFASHFTRDGTRLTFNQYKGTRKGYMAPEIHACHLAPEKRYDAPAADIFALGVLLFALVMGKLPFQVATRENKLYGLIADRKYEQFWIFHHQVNGIFDGPARTERFQSLFQRMVSFEPLERPSTGEILGDAWMA